MLKAPFQLLQSGVRAVETMTACVMVGVLAVGKVEGMLTATAAAASSRFR
jgi:hypothetical protein